MGMSLPGRRDVLRGMAIGAGAAIMGAGPAGAAPRNGKTAIVIGSGFGGAVAALRLGKAGFQTTVLERGQRWPITPAGNTFCPTNAPDGRAAWFSDRPTINILQSAQPIPRYAGVFDLVRGNGINAGFGSAVGGGSIVFGMTAMQPRRKDFERVFPRGLDYGELDRVYFPRARRVLGVSPVPPDVLAHPHFRGGRAWQADVYDFRGGEIVPGQFCVDWDTVRAELAGTKPASLTVGDSAYGVNSGAKNSVDRNYLPQAEATGNVSVLALHEVTSIREDGPRFTVTAKRIDPHGNILEHKKFTADYLFMAAGSFYTPALLLAARAQRGLTRLNNEAGKGFGNNGDYLIVRANTRRDYGSPQAGPGGVFLYDDANPDGPVSISWEAIAFPGGIGANIANNLIMMDTAERGTIEYNMAAGRAELNYPFPEELSDVDARGKRFSARFKQRSDDAHGFPLNGIPAYTRAGGFSAGATYHPLGGMVMGKACNLDGKVAGYQNLYVVDASLMPGSTALVNPSLTITAVAERCMDRFLAQH